MLLYRFARETYLRLTAPLRGALQVLIVPLPILGVIYLVKMLAFVFLVSVPIPLGIVGFIYLSINEHRGTSSWRIS